jgi:hypothetical protein
MKIHTVGNKAISIDKNFREEKLKRILQDEEKYRNESLHLDKIVDMESIKLKAFTHQMKVLTTEVDWLISKFRKEKKRNSKLIKGMVSDWNIFFIV